MQLVKMPKIQNTNDVLNFLSYEKQFIGLTGDKEPIFGRLQLPEFEILGSVKLHGTNAAVVFKINDLDDFETASFHTQSKNTAFKEGTLNGHFDFNLFVNQNISNFRDLAKKVTEEIEHLQVGDIITLFGEWAGPGIQKGVAISNIENRKFFLFSALLNDEYLDIKHVKTNWNRIHNIYEYETFQLTVNNTQLDVLKNEIDKLVSYVEEKCPVAKLFGVDGIGEGIVWIGHFIHPLSNKLVNVKFKSKGEKHAISQKDTRTKIEAPELSENVIFVINEIDVENRVHQMINEHFEGVLPGRSATGKIIELVLNDIALEETLLMTNNNVEFHEIKPFLTKRIVNYYFSI